jgi:hypothetical protein
MALGTLVHAIRGKASLKQLLKSAWRQESVKPPLLPDSYIRASGLASLCARAEVLRGRLGVSDKERFDATTLLIFLHGTSLHWGLQNRALPEIGVLYGLWRCEGCGKIHGSIEPSKPLASTVILRPKICSCGVTEFTYHEHKFVDEKYRITGHADGFLVLPGLSGMGILELSP